MIIDDGGPAFPHEVEYLSPEGAGRTPHSGMSMRDYFAAKAMQAVLAQVIENTADIVSAVTKLSTAAYRVADAMLKARETTP